MNQRILLVDDDDIVSQSLALALQSEGFVVECARSGREGVRRITAAPPDLVLLDLHMPGKDGWHAFDLMEKFQPLLPVIVITARSNQIARARAAGIDALMEKPLDLPLLLQTIRELLAETEAERVARLIRPNFAPRVLARDAAAAPRPSP
jgi:CheY-like chemotaxis protein